MTLNWRSLISLKWQVLVAFVVLWNAGFLLAIYLGGGSMMGAMTPIGMKVTGIVCALASVFGLSVATSQQIQARLVAPSRAQDFNSREFYFLAFVTGVLALSRFFMPAPVGPGGAF